MLEFEFKCSNSSPHRMKIYCTGLWNGGTTYILTIPKIIVVKSFSAKTSFAQFQFESFMGKVHYKYYK